MGIDAGELGCPSRCTQRKSDEVGQSAEKIALAIIRIAGLEGIVMAIAHEVARGYGTLFVRLPRSAGTQPPNYASQRLRRR